MKALALGIIVIIVAVLTLLPSGLGWWEDTLLFLRGSLPLLTIGIGLLLIFVGISDIRDWFDSRKDPPSS